MRTVADFLRKAVSALEQPDHYARTHYLQIEINIAQRAAAKLSGEIAVARAMRCGDQVIELSRKLQDNARQVIAMCECVAREFDRAAAVTDDHAST